MKCCILFASFVAIFLCVSCQDMAPLQRTVEQQQQTINEMQTKINTMDTVVKQLQEDMKVLRSSQTEVKDSVNKVNPAYIQGGIQEGN